MQFGESIGGRVGFTLELFELKNKHEVPYLTLYDLSGPTSYYEKKVSLLCDHSYKIWKGSNVKQKRYLGKS